MQRNIEIRVITGLLPDSIHAAATTEGADRYTVVINENATQDEKAAGFLHECLHIWHNDFKEGQQITKLEKQRAAELKRLFAGRDQEEQEGGTNGTIHHGTMANGSDI